ncbi:hypothetical protein QOZ80_9AG0684960 [Eleusine coracana subsp. coracana]|nr:hypothetical protein QOZ80_9AG0684960 [Eleusine coracana subsp. coracana]
MPWPDQVAQYNLIGYLARNKKHSWVRKLATLLVCKDYLDQLWCMKPCESSRDITKLVQIYLIKGWTEHIKDMNTYREFNDNRGHWTLKTKGCHGKTMKRILQKPFDESVVLWHLATDFCFYHLHTSPSQVTARRCREISNYMVYLLFVNPEMMMPGARRGLFKDAYGEIEGKVKESPSRDEDELAHNIIKKIEGTAGPGSIHCAWALAQELLGICKEGVEREEKMWEVIQGVWVEMLCFSAGWCRGYLHAKSLGKGGEYLSYIWMLQSYMGMESLTERMQRMDLQEGRDGGDENV